MLECHECGSESAARSPVGFSQFLLQLKLLAAHLHVVCVGVRVHARVRGRVWRRGWVMGDLDVPNFTPPPPFLSSGLMRGCATGCDPIVMVMRSDYTQSELMGLAAITRR